MKITFIFSCSGMFRHVPVCSGMFRNVPCSWFYRRPDFLPFKPTEGLTNIRVTADCEHFFRRLRLKAHFSNNEESDIQATDDNTDPFETLSGK